MFCAARGIVRNAQPKTVPAKNSEAIFWRPRFTWPLRAGKRANANFACSEGFFLSGVPRHVPGWPFLRGWPLLRRLLRPVFRRFSAGVPLPCSRPAAVRRFLSGLRCLLAVCPPSPLFPACRPPAAFVLGPRRRGLLAVCLPCALFWLFVHLSVLFARVFSLVFLPFPA